MVEFIEIRVVKSDGKYVFEKREQMSFDMWDFMVNRAVELEDMVERIKKEVELNSKG